MVLSDYVAARRAGADYILSFKSKMIPQDDVEEIVATIVRLDGAIPATVRKAHVANLRRRHASDR